MGHQSGERYFVPDATTVVITFNEPYAPWLTTLFNFTPAMPEHALRPCLMPTEHWIMPTGTEPSILQRAIHAQ
ncbi:MAG: hypothetical protein R3E39_17590 [Anaerolineae bacterium]